MPSYRGHLLGGLAAFIITSNIIPATYLPNKMTSLSFLVQLSICLLGALFPDIDTKSVGRRIFYCSLIIGVTIAAFQKSYPLIIFYSMLGLFPLLTPHRGMTHNPIFLLFGPIVLLRIAYPDAHWLTAAKMHHYIFFISGAISHILLDFAPFGLFKRKNWKKKTRA